MRSLSARTRRLLPLALCVGGLVGTGLVTPSVASADPAPAVTVVDLPTGGSKPSHIVAGPDGALWFTELASHKLGRITTTGQVSEIAVPSDSSVEDTGPDEITAGPDAIWFADEVNTRVWRVPVGAGGAGAPEMYKDSPLGDPTAPLESLSVVGSSVYATTRYGDELLRFTTGVPGSWASVPVTCEGPSPTLADGSGGLWFGCAGQLGGPNQMLRRIASDGAISSLPIDPARADVGSMAYDASGRLWWTAWWNGGAWSSVSPHDSALGYLDAAGAHTVLLKDDAGPSNITLGGDGHLWFTTVDRSTMHTFLIRIDGEAVAASYDIGPRSVSDLTAGPDKALWFTDSGANQIGRIALPAAVVANPGTGTSAAPTPTPTPTTPVTSPKPVAPKAVLCAVTTKRSGCRSTVGARSVRVALTLDRKATVTLTVRPAVRRGAKVPTATAVVSRTLSRGTSVLTWNRKVAGKPAKRGQWVVKITAGPRGARVTKSMTIRL